MWNGEIKVITGIRRCGKSVLLFDLFYNYLLEKGTNDENIIKIELDQRRYYKYRNPITLCEYVESIVLENKNEKFYLFVDEVQLTKKVTDHENGDIDVTIYDMLNELKAYKNLDVYVTGSNSKGLSNDIATEFRGRVHPPVSRFRHLRHSVLREPVTGNAGASGLPVKSTGDRREVLHSTSLSGIRNHREYFL